MPKPETFLLFPRQMGLSAFFSPAFLITKLWMAVWRGSDADQFARAWSVAVICWYKWPATCSGKSVLCTSFPRLLLSCIYLGVLCHVISDPSLAFPPSCPGKSFPPALRGKEKYLNLIEEAVEQTCSMRKGTSSSYFSCIGLTRFAFLSLTWRLTVSGSYSDLLWSTSR